MLPLLLQGSQAFCPTGLSVPENSTLLFFLEGQNPGLEFSTFIVFIILGPRVGVAKDFLDNLARLEVDFGYTMVVAPFWIPNRLS
jgi:hypothetical protein